MRRAVAISVILVILVLPFLYMRAHGEADSVPDRIWRDDAQASQLEQLGQTLTDSIGARLTGSQADRSAHEWVRAVYQRRGFKARTTAYDTLQHGWDRGLTHIDLIAPRQRTLEGVIVGYSPGTNGDVEAPVVAIPDNLTSPGSFGAWLSGVRGKFVLMSFARPTCREQREWLTYASPAYRAKEAEWDVAFKRWWSSVKQSGVDYLDLPALLERSGAVGIISSSALTWGYEGRTYASTWEGYIGGTLHEALYPTTENIPILNLVCEDYGLVARLAMRDQQPRLRVNSTAKLGSPAPVLHTVAELTGAERPDEYVVIGEHLDSMDPASGATDNGTGTLAAMEAMRLLQKYYPRPKRTIVAHHWSGEEQGLSWNQWFTEDNTAVASKIQVALTHDTGTGRTVFITLTGPASLAAAWSRWAMQLPRGVLDTVVVRPMQIGAGRSSAFPGSPACAGVPQVWTNAYNFEKRWDFGTKQFPEERWNYGYGYHGNRDTYDLIVFDEVEHNAKLLAMLAYAAASDSVFIPATPEYKSAELKPCSQITPRVKTVKHPKARASDF
jgi:carboxypeptidase Q